MKERHIKIYEAPGLKNNIPRILLQGNWLSEIGFHVGDHIKISYQENRLVIEVESNSSPNSTTIQQLSTK